MDRTSSIRAGLFVAIFLPGLATGQEAQGDRAAFEQRVWKLTETVMEKHVESPARQQMLLGGMRALLARVHIVPPADLGQQVSRLVSREEFATLLDSFWPKSGATTAELEDAFLTGLCRSVPGDTRILDADDLRVAEQISGNRYEGTGIQVMVHKEEKLVQVLSALPRSPARQAGMRANDLIVAVDGESMADAGIQKVVKSIRGVLGSEVTITVRQPGTKDTRDLHMIRGVIPFDLVVGHQRLTEEQWDYRVSPGEPVAYLRITSLSSSTLHELRQAEQRLLAGGFRAVVLDLRFLNGGDLHHAALVADGLIDGGVLWRTRDARGKLREWQADRECLFRGWPLAVLISRRTHGSGPEMLAAALQDKRRAILVGEPTASQGDRVETIVPVPESNLALHLWTESAERAEPAPRKAADRHERHVMPQHELRINDPEWAALFTWNAEQERGDKLGVGKVPEDRQLAKALEVLQTALKKAG